MSKQHKYNESGKGIVGASLVLSGVCDDGSAFEDMELESTGEVQSVSLKAGGYVLTEVNPPTGYTVAEPIEFVVALDGSVTIDGESVTVVQMTDIRVVNSLAVTKKVTGNLGDKSKLFDFNLTFTAAEDEELLDEINFVRTDASGTVIEGVVTNGSYSFQLGHGDKIEFNGIPYGTSYEVTEDENSSQGYVVTADNSSGIFEGSDINVSFTNHRDSGVPTASDTPLDMNLRLLIWFVLAFVVTLIYILKKKFRRNMFEE